MQITFPISRYRTSFRAPERGRAISGSAWRGAFGNALKRTVCAMRRRSCDDCPLVDTCAFPYLFEGRQRADAQVLRSLDRVPVPYMFQTPPDDGRMAGEGIVTVDLTLVGHANQRLIYVVHALAEAGAGGLGRDRARLELVAVDRLADLEGRVVERVFENGQFRAPEPPSSPPSSLTDAKFLDIHLKTPLRLKLKGKLLTPERFHPGDLVDAVVRRASALAAFHTDAPLEGDFRALKQLARLLETTEAALKWSERLRYSSRQEQKMAMGGIVGRVSVRVPEEARGVLLWLDLGQWIGAGKGVSMGLGQYTARPLADS